jgi:hypothetical protein
VEVREITRSPLILESAVIISSWIPCAKNAFSLSELRLSNGSTATDLSMVAAGGAGAVCFGGSAVAGFRVRAN